MAVGSSLALELGTAADYANAPAGKLRLGVDSSGGIFTKDELGNIQFYGVEGVEDIVGGMFVDTATIDFTYNDGLGQITADLKDASVTTPKMALTAGTLTFPDSLNVALGTGAGTQWGTGTTQKQAWYGATPVAQIAGSTDVLAGLVTLGFRAASSNPPLNLGTGALTAGTTNVGALTASSIAGTGTVALTGTTTVSEGVNFVLGTVTGTKWATDPLQKQAWWNATPVVQPAGSTDVLASLVTLGLRAASSNPPLNLGTGALTAGTTSVGAFSSTSITATGTVALTDNMTITDGKNIVLNTTTGTQIGTGSTQKLGFLGATPVAQISGSTDVLAGLVTIGLRAASSNPPLNLGTGNVTAGNGTFLKGTTTKVAAYTSSAVGGGNEVGFYLGDTSSTDRAAMRWNNVADFRLQVGTIGNVDMTLMTNSTDRLRLSATALTFSDAVNMTFNATTGTKIGTGTTQKLAFWNATPIVQPTRVGPIVDNVSGGGSTSPTIPDLAAAAVDGTAASLASTRATCASLAEAIKAIEVRLSAAGGGVGITA